MYILFAWCLVSVIVYDVTGTVHNITTKSYAEMTNKSPYVIFYFTDTDPNCEMCGFTHPKFITISQLFNEKETLFLRSINAPLFKTLGVDMKDLPTVGFLSKSHTKPRFMKEAITVDSLISHVVARSEGTVVRPMRVSYELMLTSENFYQIVMNPNLYVMIFLHENDDSEKRRLFESIAKIFKNDYEIVLATLDRSQEGNLSKQFAMLQLPAIYWYDLTNKTKKRFGGQFELNELVTFINDQTNIDRKPNGELMDSAGRVPHMEALVAKNIEDIAKVEHMARVIKMFEQEAGRVKNNRRYATYYVELLRAVKRAKTVKILDDELNKISLSVGREELTPTETDEAVKHKHILQKVIGEVTSYLARDKETVRDGTGNDIYVKDGKVKQHLRDEL